MLIFWLALTMAFNIPTAGTESAPITFHAEPGAIIDSVTIWGGTNAGINASNQSYLTIEGVTLTPSRPWPTRRRTQLRSAVHEPP